MTMKIKALARYRRNHPGLAQRHIQRIPAHRYGIGLHSIGMR
ncbi:MAG: hypothetical protein ACOH2B_08720 [Burkholderiaceae bacterium]